MNLILRILVALIFIPVILWCSYEGGFYFYALILIFSVIAVIEFLNKKNLYLFNPYFWMALIAVMASVILTARNNLYFGQLEIIIAYLIIISTLTIINDRNEVGDNYNKFIHLVSGPVFLCLFYPYIIKIEQLNCFPYSFTSGDLLMFLFGIVWVGDTAAMFIGKWFGAIPIAPQISSHKTVIGALANLIAVIIFACILSAKIFHGLPVLSIIIIAAVASIIGQAGDLAESMWKRSLNIKDSSHIIPGHGGILDRFDSLLFAAPIVYYGFKWFVL